MDALAYETTPLDFAICNKHPACAEFLLDSGAKMANIRQDMDIPAWMLAIIAKRRNVMRSLFTLIGVLRRRFEVPGAATAHIANRVPLDMVRVIAIHVWNSRLDPRWV